MAPAPTPLADIITNRTSISLARSQRLIASWLPPSSDSKTEAKQEEEDARTFTPEPELLGLGRSLPKTGESDDHGEAFSVADNVLRKRILGKRKRHYNVARLSGHYGTSNPRPSKPGPEGHQELEVSSEEEAGRSALGKERRVASSSDDKKMPNGKKNSTEALTKNNGRPNEVTSDISGATPSRQKTFLDEVLQGPAKKRKRKRKKQKKQKKQSQAADQ